MGHSKKHVSEATLKKKQREEANEKIYARYEAIEWDDKHRKGPAIINPSHYQSFAKREIVPRIEKVVKISKAVYSAKKGDVVKVGNKRVSKKEVKTYVSNLKSFVIKTVTKMLRNGDSVLKAEKKEQRADRKDSAVQRPVVFKEDAIDLLRVIVEGLPESKYRDRILRSQMFNGEHLGMSQNVSTILNAFIYHYRLKHNVWEEQDEDTHEEHRGNVRLTDLSDDKVHDEDKYTQSEAAAVLSEFFSAYLDAVNTKMQENRDKRKTSEKKPKKGKKSKKEVSSYTLDNLSYTSFMSFNHIVVDKRFKPKDLNDREKEEYEKNKAQAHKEMKAFSSLNTLEKNAFEKWAKKEMKKAKKNARRERRKSSEQRSSARSSARSQSRSESESESESDKEDSSEEETKKKKKSKKAGKSKRSKRSN